MHPSKCSLFVLCFIYCCQWQCDAFLYVDRCCLVMLRAVQLYACPVSTSGVIEGRSHYAAVYYDVPMPL